jgi:hypothetical protein
MIIGISGKIGSEEKWKDIIGYEGYYQISNLGRVKRLEGKCLTKGNSYRSVKEKILKPFPNKARGNYLYINLNMYGVIQQYRLHILVAKHFIPNPSNLPEINHIDGIKEHNYVSNLEWCTQLHNMQHSFKIGTHKIRKGNSSPNHKLTSEQIIKIREELSLGKTGRHLAFKYNVSEGMISLVKHNKNWN